MITLSLFLIKGSLVIAGATALIGIASLVASRKSQTIMTINKNGFFYYGSLLTNWSNFVSAEFLDEMPTLSSTSSGLSDKFSLYIKYYRDDKPGCFGRKIPLTNTQDKSEEEIIAAIRFYSRNNTIVY
jgi:hypothetical protein